VRDSARIHVDAPASEVLDRITDLARLPEWNHAIIEVLERPTRLETGSIWKVRMHALGQAWVSKSTLLRLDRAGGAFRHRSQTDDGNPSYADWAWHVAAEGDGATVTVTVDLHPQTFWRKHLLVHLRRRQLRREMRASLAALAESQWQSAI
jgi:hypothetical protein